MDNNELDKIREKARELGFSYEVKYRGCGQCLVASVQDTLGVRNDAVFKAATGFAGGIGLMQDSACGAYAGGVMILSSILGRERTDFEDPENIRLKTMALVQKLHDRFMEEYGAVNCREIHQAVFGRFFNLRDPEERAAFDRAGGHTEKCPGVVGLSAGWTVEILAREGLV